MSQFAAKFKLIFIPYLIISAATIILYTFLHWLLLIQFSLFQVKDIIITFWAPCIMPWLPILVLLTRRIKLLDLKSKKGDPLWTYQGTMWIAMAVPLVIAQPYIISATGKLTVLDTINEIATKPASKYYTLKKFYIDKEGVALRSVSTVSGKFNRNLNYTIYAPCPVLDTKPVRPDTGNYRDVPVEYRNALFILNEQKVSHDTLKWINSAALTGFLLLNNDVAYKLYGNEAKNGVVQILVKKGVKLWKPHAQVPKNHSDNVWLAINYSKTIGNRLAKSEKQKIYEEFAKQSRLKFNKTSLNGFKCLERLAYSDDYENYVKAITQKDNTKSAKQIILLSPNNDAYENRNGNKLIWLLGSYVICSLIVLIALHFKQLLKKKSDAPYQDIS